MVPASSDRIQGLRDAVDRLTADVDSRGGASEVAAIVDEIRAAVERLETAMAGGKRLTPYQRFERVRGLDAEFQDVVRLWTDVVLEVGTQAADFILKGVDVEAAWMARWGGLFPTAWQLRTELQEREARQGIDLVARTQRGSIFMETSTRYDDTAVPDHLMLDLRHGAGLPLARIGELLNRSPATIQSRIAAFDNRVMEAVVHAAVKEQIPEGWSLVVAPGIKQGNRLFRPDFGLEREGEPLVQIEVLAVWDDHEPVGRPREAMILHRRRALGGNPLIWAVALAEGSDIRFLPDTMLSRRENSARQLLAIAQTSGFNRLGEALDYTLDRSQVQPE